MTNHFILTTQSAELAGNRPPLRHKSEVEPTPAGRPGGLAVGDKVLFLLERDGGLEAFSPHVYRVQSAAGRVAELELDHSREDGIAADKAREILNRGFVAGRNALTAEEFETLLTLMGGVRISEERLLDHVKRYVAARGYYFDDETLFNYHICLKTRPLVILAGLSGTGKSKLSQLYAEALGHTVQNERYLRLAVRPSWNDDRYMLGYLDTLSGDYVAEPAIEFVMQAERDRSNLYFLCLDEMNLAHVEYYFSQFLSALEEENPADRRIPLYSKAAASRMARQGKAVEHERVAIISPNLLFTGTINVDETTQPLSDKVIDRANTIEFFDVALDKAPERQAPPEPVHVSAAWWFGFQASKPDASQRSKVVEIGKILNRGGLGLGYRVLREIELYAANAAGLLKPEVAFDLQVKQRVLPRVRGTAAIQPVLVGLRDFAKQTNLPRTQARVEEMEQRLKRDGYTSFWR